MNNLVPLSGTQIANRAQAGAAATYAPPAVQQAMREIVVNYVHPGESAEDRTIVLRTWARETAAYPAEIVTEALNRLLRTNPRAPFRPCIADVLKACDQVRERWAAQIVEWYRQGNVEAVPDWCKPIVRDALSKAIKRELEDAIRWDYRGRPPYGITDGDHARWAVAQRLGRLDRWPSDILDDAGIAHGDALTELDKRIKAAKADDDQRAARAAAEAGLCGHYGSRWFRMTRDERERLIVEEVVAQAAKSECAA